MPVARFNARPVPILRRVFSFPVLLCALLALLAVLTVRERFNNPDLWWNLKTGEVIWNTRSIPTTDIFSYTTHHIARPAPEWISQIFMYGAYRLGGYSGLMVWFCLFAAALLVAGYLLCWAHSGNAKVAFLGGMILWFFSTVGLEVRSQMVGYLLLIVELLVVYLGRTRSARWFYILPPLFALWVNCHASFFFGLVILGVYLVCAFFHFHAGSLIAPAWERGQRRALAVAFVISLGAVFLNPMPLQQVLYPVNTMLHQHIVVTQVSEWQPLPFNDPRGLALLGILVAIAVYAMVARRAGFFLDEMILLAMGAWLALNHQRMAFVFGVLAAPVVSRLLRRAWDDYAPETDHPFPNAVLTVIALCGIYFAFPSSQNLAMQVERENPVKAVNFIKEHHLQGNMLNSFNDGGYLIWALPHHPVFIDGRADVFAWTGVMREYGEWALLQSNPEDLLRKYDIGFCLIDQGSPMSHVMPLLPGWTQVYSDSYAEIFVRTAVANSLSR